MTRWVSEAIQPLQGSFDPADMSRGEPGLPAGFIWRDRTVRVLERLRSWKVARPEPGGEMYVRRHYVRVRMDDGAEWTVYCLRQGPKQRWFLYSIE